MTLQQLTYFLTAAEHRSFSAAAEALHMAQPSLSEQIRRLEAELGVSLFARTGRRLELTEAGLRVVGQNSAEVADAVRDGHLEAGLVVLPVDDRGLDVRPAMREELLYVSAEPRRTREAVRIERLAAAPLILYDARWGADDPTRRQLRERAQRAGVKLEPQIEVEYMTAALDLAARGLGDTVSPRSILVQRGYARRLAGVAFDPPLYDTFAFI